MSGRSSTPDAHATRDVRQRRAHRKSRQGCLQCKKRRHKCDELRPRCGECERFDTSCSFGTLTDATRAASHGHGGVGASPSTLLAPEQTSGNPLDGENGSTAAATPHTPTGLPHYQALTWRYRPTDSSAHDHALDLELMAYISIDTCRELGTTEDADQPFYYAEDLLRLAFSHRFLLHELLAVAALRLFAKDRNRVALWSASTHHQSEALRLVRPHIGEVSQNHSVAMLFFSSYAAIAGSASTALSPGSTDDAAAQQGEHWDPISSLVHVAGLNRGILTTTRRHFEHIRASWAWPLLRERMQAGDDLQPYASGVPGYQSLRGLAFGLEGRESREACLDAVDSIFNAISVLQQDNSERICQRLATSWAAEVDPKYFDLLLAGKPVALVVLAHYAAMLSTCTGLWWVYDMPETIIRHVDAALGEEWAEFLRWPKAQIFPMATA